MKWETLVAVEDQFDRDSCLNAHRPAGANMLNGWIRNFDWPRFCPLFWAGRGGAGWPLLRGVPGASKPLFERAAKKAPPFFSFN